MRRSADAASEAARLAALDCYQIMDTGRDERFDRITRLAAQVLAAPISLVSFVGADRQWFKSAFGLALDSTPRTVSFCAHTIGQDGPLAVPDATQDRRFANNPLVTGPPGICFYAGVPLRVERKHAIGSLCVIDHVPRDIDERELDLLNQLGAVLVDVLELHRLMSDARRAESDVRQTERRLNSIINHLFTFVVVLGVDGSLLEANDASLAACGLTLGDVMGRPFWDCYWWSDADHAQAMIRTAVETAAGGQKSRFDVALRIKDGGHVVTDFMVAPLTDSSGTVTHIVASGVDVSERNAIADERRRLARIVEEAPFLIRTATPEGRLTYINRAGRDLIGYAADADLSAAEVAHHHPDWTLYRLRNEGYPQARKSGTWSGETAVYTSDGREIPTSHVIIAHRAANNEAEFFSSIVVDISAAKLAAESLKISEARFRGTFENAAVGIAHIGNLGQWHRVNERLLEIVGYARTELVQTTFQAVSHPDDLSTSLGRFEDLKSGRIDSYTMEQRLISKDGSVVWVQATVSMQETVGDAEPYLIAVIEDIGERKFAEHRQRLLLAELNHRVKNTLAIVQSIANQSLRQTQSPQTFTASFLGRLHALSGAHDLLTAQSWYGVELSELLRQQITFNGAVAPHRLQLDGPALMLSPAVALNLAIALHELAANAMQFGAFANDRGSIEVQWSTRGNGLGRIAEIVWRERNGPQVMTPKRTGGGSTLVERSLRQGLGGKYALDWKESGLEIHLALPLPHRPVATAWFEA